MANVTIQAFDGLSQSVSSGKNRAETFNSWAYSQDLCFGQDKITLTAHFPAVLPYTRVDQWQKLNCAELQQWWTFNEHLTHDG